MKNSKMPPMRKIALLAVDGDTTWMLYNYLHQQDIVIDYVVLETPISKWQLIQRRIKKLGLWTVFGQLLFQAWVPTVLRRFSKKRIEAILKEYHSSTAKPDINTIHSVTSINDDETLQWLLSHPVDVILVNGTRIISKRLLEQLPCTFINTHLGITPAYRGVHGGFWAKYQNDLAQFGTTIHLVDAGIDTGKVLQHIRTQPTKEDNFSTYPYLQMASSLPAMVSLLQMKNLPDALPNSSGISNLYYHPTLWQYLKARLRGIK